MGGVLQDTEAAAVSPAFNAGWEETGDAQRRRAVATKASTAMATQSITSALSAGDLLFRQYVSDALSGAQTISGKCYCQIRTSEALGTADAISRLILYVVSNDGGTVRGTLLTLADYSTGTEWATALTNKVFANGDAMTSVAALDGDRIVAEFGSNHGAVAVSQSMSWGDDNAQDLADIDEAGTTALNPWIALEGVYTFQGAAVDVYSGRGVGRGIGRGVMR